MSLSRSLRYALARLGVAVVGLGADGGIAAADTEDRRDRQEIPGLCEGRRPARAPGQAEAAAHIAALALPLHPSALRTLEQLAEEETPEVRAAVADGLGRLLIRMSGLERTQVVASWATSDRPAHRLAVATALTHGAAGVGVESALRYLCTDPDPLVATAAAGALRSRGGSPGSAAS
jgi:hypothetical protein